MAVASNYGLTLADVDSLKLWEFNYLAEELEAEQSKTKTSASGRYPPGATPVMT